MRSVDHVDTPSGDRAHKPVAVLGVCGGIAAYKSCQLVRDLQDRGFDVHVVMTENALEFVGPITFKALSGNHVATGLWQEPGAATGHISLAQHADVLVIAPATANIVAKLASGVADDLLSTLAVATQAPIVIAPAMNPDMYDDETVRSNLAALRARGIAVVEPDAGVVACGDVGVGKLAATARIAEEADLACVRYSLLTGLHFLVSAGPTREPVDAARYLSNRSSGKMGYAIARALLRLGGQVTLVSGPTALAPPRGANFVPVETAQEMAEAILARIAESNVYIGAAAVADFKVSSVQDGKISRSEGSGFSLDLVPNMDIVATLGAMRTAGELSGSIRLVAFAAECCDSQGALASAAVEKMTRKQVDAVVANRVGPQNCGFDSDTNEVLVVTGDSVHHIPMASKNQIARTLVDYLVDSLDLVPRTDWSTP